MRLLYGSILVAFLLRSGCILFSVRFWSACLLFGCLSILMFHSAAECPLAVRMLPNLWCLLRFRSGHFSSAFRNTLRLSSSRPVMPFWLPFGCSPVFSCWSPVSGFTPVAGGVDLRWREPFPAVCRHVPSRLRGECSPVTIQLPSDCFLDALRPPLVCFPGGYPTGQQPQQQRQPQQFAFRSPSACSPTAHRLPSDPLFGV